MDALKDLDVSVIAASVDAEDKAGEMAAELSYPVAYGVTQAQAEALGAWWEPNRGIIQPTEFLLDADQGHHRDLQRRADRPNERPRPGQGGPVQRTPEAGRITSRERIGVSPTTAARPVKEPARSGLASLE